jgi:hypothetical protein
VRFGTLRRGFKFRMDRIIYPANSPGDNIVTRPTIGEACRLCIALGGSGECDGPACLFCYQPRDVLEFFQQKRDEFFMLLIFYMGCDFAAAYHIFPEFIILSIEKRLKQPS